MTDKKRETRRNEKLPRQISATLYTGCIILSANNKRIHYYQPNEKPQKDWVKLDKNAIF